ncbi:DUF4097 family beta strand repeat-containing protein, partial [Undibacterium sp. 5I2]
MFPRFSFFDASRSGTWSFSSSSMRNDRSSESSSEWEDEDVAGPGAWIDDAYLQSGGEIAGTFDSMGKDMELKDVLVRADLRMNTMSGDISLRRLRTSAGTEPSVKIATMSGDLLLEDVAVSGDFSTISGKVVARNVRAACLSTLSGRMKLERVQVQNASLGSTALRINHTDVSQSLKVCAADGERIEIGTGCRIKELHVQTVYCRGSGNRQRYVRVSPGFSGVFNGHNYQNGQPVGSQPESRQAMRHITIELGDGSVINEIVCDALKCTVILGKFARYTGPISANMVFEDSPAPSRSAAGRAAPQAGSRAHAVPPHRQPAPPPPRQPAPPP